MYDQRVLRLTTAEECEQFAKNVEKREPDPAIQARRRAVELRALKYGAKTDAERDAIQAVYAFEEVRSKETGRRSHASRTWQSINRNGILRTVEMLVARKKTTEGYDALIRAGMEDFTFEAVVLRHHEAFSTEAVNQAKNRLSDKGYKGSTVPK